MAGVTIEALPVAIVGAVTLIAAVLEVLALFPSRVLPATIAA